MEVILKILFLIFSNANLQFVDKELKWKSYRTTKALPTTKRVEFINKKKFPIVVLDENVKIFVVLITTLSTTLTLVLQVYFFCQAQVGLLLANKTLIKVLSKYLDYINIFSFNLVIELTKTLI